MWIIKYRSRLSENVLTTYVGGGPWDYPSELVDWIKERYDVLYVTFTQRG